MTTETQIIWADVLFFIDFSMDFLALYLMLRIMGRRPCALRLITASVLSALFGCAAAIFGGSKTGYLLLSALTAAVSCLIALPEKRVRVRTLFSSLLLFAAAEAVIGGLMTFICLRLDRLTAGGVRTSSSEFHLFRTAAALTALLVTGLVRFLTGGRAEDEGDSVLRLESDGKTFDFPCFFDTGNLAREPISGLPVIFLPPGTAHAFAEHTMRLIPITTVNGEHLCRGYRPKHLTLISGGTSAEIDAYLVITKEVGHPGKEPACAILPPRKSLCRFS
ncbi:MAG: sigma-E processing peptidase SpoIIGA [Clostridia bacterium]|nr:sigma-E processing peptidase SpoIIGA [Clostridia bacterium]